MKDPVTRFKDAILGDQAVNRVVAIIGLSKNAGKTTLLNWLLTETKVSCSGVITTGRDGEDKDTITGLSKPKVSLPANTLYTTFASALHESSAQIEIIRKLPFKATGKNLWLVRSLLPIQTEIVGPASVKDQILLAGILQEAGAEQVIIDGSLDRKAISLHENVDALALVISPTYGNTAEIMKETGRLYSLSQIVVSSCSYRSDHISYQDMEGMWHPLSYQSMLGREREIIAIIEKQVVQAIYLPCTLTDRSFQVWKPYLRQFSGEMILKHPILLHINAENMKWFEQNLSLKTIHPFPIRGIAINTSTVTGNHLACEKFRLEVRKQIPTIPILDVKELLI